MTITIRRATLADISFLREMIWQALLASPRVLRHLGIANVQQHEAEYWASWNPNTDPAFIAFDEQQHETGAVVLYQNDEQPLAGYRIGIAVSEQARGSGVGTALLKCAVRFAQEQQLQYVNLAVDPTNVPALSLYTKFGFLVVDRQEHAIVMILRLPATL